MPYVTRPQLLDGYTPSSAVLVSNDAEKSSASDTYIKIKEIKLIKTIYGQSRFTFSFDLRENLATHDAFGKIYKNGVAIGTEQIVNGVTYETKTENIDIGNWIVGDTIELWVHRETAWGQVVVRNFRMSGIGSPFINTVGM
jgi:hypothetical protein